MTSIPCHACRQTILRRAHANTMGDRYIYIRSATNHELKSNIDTRTLAKLVSNGIHHAIDTASSSLA